MKSRAAELETEYADDAVVQGALTKKYRELKKYTDAERCALRRIQIVAGLHRLRCARGDL